MPRFTSETIRQVSLSSMIQYETCSCLLMSESHERCSMILPKDRDPRFITIRRGGTLTDSDHHLLALWAAACAEHVLHLFESGEAFGPAAASRN